MSVIDRDRREPFYVQLAAILRGRISSGDIPGPWLPGKPALKQEYRTSQTTVEGALRILREEGLIEFIPGKGYYVLRGKRQG